MLRQPPPILIIVSQAIQKWVERTLSTDWRLRTGQAQRLYVEGNCIFAVKNTHRHSSFIIRHNLMLHFNYCSFRLFNLSRTLGIYEIQQKKRWPCLVLVSLTCFHQNEPPDEGSHHHC